MISAISGKRQAFALGFFPALSSLFPTTGQWVARLKYEVN